MFKKTFQRKRIDPSDSIFTGEQFVDKISIQLFSYSKDHVEETIEPDLKSLSLPDTKTSSFWLNCHGLHEPEIINKICDPFNIDQLFVMDILDVNQRQKISFSNKYCFITLKSLLPGVKEIELEQLSIIIGKNYLISFQEKKSNYFEHIRSRIRSNIGSVRSKNADYLLYVIIESILENFERSLQYLDDQMEILGPIDIDSDPSPLRLRKIESLKRQCNQVKTTLNPIREIIFKLIGNDTKLISEENTKYFHEIKDYCISQMDSADRQLIRLESASNMFFSVQGYRMNQIMKTLTMIATIFIPLTFIAGIYGMNFTTMPELSWEYGYPTIWITILVITIGIIIYFKKKKWL